MTPRSAEARRETAGEPRSEAELAGMLQRAHAAGTRLVPVAGGTQIRFALRPEERLSLAALPASVEIDAYSLQARVRGPATWGALEAEAIGHGLCASHLARPAEGCSVLGTLAAPGLLPETWLSASPAAACLALEALDRQGLRTSTVDAPRTASGPDLRRLHLGREGRLGVLLAATLSLVRAGATTLLASDDPAALHPIRRALSSVPHRVTLLPGTEAHRFRLLVRDADTPEGAWIESSLRNAGLDALPAGSVRRPERASPALLVAAPWALLRGLWSASRSTVRIESATATHALVALAHDARGTPGRIAALAEAVDADLAALVRVAWRGSDAAAHAPQWPHPSQSLLADLQSAGTNPGVSA